MHTPGKTRTLAPLLVCLSLPTVLWAAERPRVGNGGKFYTPPSVTSGMQVQPADVTQLLQCLVGPDVQISNAVLTAANGAAGLFTGGSAIIGIDQGIVLSSGSIVTIVGPNLMDDASFNNDYPGDADLDALIPGYQTYDATILEFDFTCPDPTVVSFQYVFASEEYNEWVGSEFNDVFGFFLNGNNVAVVPADCGNPGIPVAINNVDCQNPYNPPNGPNCDCYRNNALPDGGGLIDTEMDGLTQTFYATAQLQPGTNHMKFAIADAGDHVLDSNVMIHCQSFACAAPPEVGACCIGDDDCFLVGRDQCIQQGGTYRGDNVQCSPNPCQEVPVEEHSWGQIKVIYR